MVWFSGSSRDARLLFVCLSLAVAVVGAVCIVLSPVSSARAQAAGCEDRAQSLRVPGADKQEEYCLADLTTKGLVDGLHTNRSDWEGGIALHALGTVNPPEPVPGIQVNGCFPDDSTTNGNPACDHDSQFVMRFPDDWNGRLVITGPPGNRTQYANDFVISDYVLSKGYAFASTDKGNTGNQFYEDGERPGDAVVEWHKRVEQLTRAAKPVVQQRYGTLPRYTYITGISNAGYLTRYALENTPGLYDGGVDWEGTLFRRNGPNLFTFLPPALRNYPECQAQGFSGQACERMYNAGFEPGSEFLWPQHYDIYWDLTQRIYREEFDPGYDGDREEEDGIPGTPFCQNDGDPQTRCDAEYRYQNRPERVKEAVERVSLTGNIGKPMLTLHGTYDALLPIDADSNPYRELVEKAGKGNLHRYYKIAKGNHVDRFYNEFPEDGPSGQRELRPILPCHRAAFEELVEWVEKGNKPPPSKLVRKQESDDPVSGDVVNYCSINEEAVYSGPTD